ncbi:MAG: tetratricopeptide repeat protein [Chloroflexales bacterium]|nr:tetratricopeptide repeat protein [Chloroflexales bacterium]
MWVRRERLLAQLRARPSARLTVVVAPAGFGKSTLVAQWLSIMAEDERRKADTPDQQASALSYQPSAFAWLTLDKHDQDGLRFMAYVAGAIERAIPQALALTRPLLSAPEPPLYMVAQALLVDLSALPASLTLVLDDYHLVTAEPIHQTVAYLLRHLPPTCRLVVLSRADPPLPMARMRAEHQVTEVRAADLRFTEAEAGALLASLSGYAPDAALVAALHQETEGWAIALQLAALARLEAPSLERIPGAATRRIAEYLAEEVLDQQPAPIQQALLALAVPERVCAELGAALLHPPDDQIRAEYVLEQLARANLLLPLDTTGRWYRFHNLFRDLLLRRLALGLGRDAVGALQLRAARWLEAADLGEEAVRLYLAAGAEDAAADLVERLLLPRLGRDRGAGPPGYWLRLLPADLVARRQGLTLLEARRASNIFDLAALAENLRRLDALLAAQGGPAGAPPWPGFQADRTALWGALHFWQGRPAEAIDAMRAALAQGPVEWIAVQALMLLGQSLVGLGRYAEAVRQIEAVGASSPDRPHPGRAPVAAFCRCGIHMHAGELDALAGEAQRLLETAAAPDLDPLWTSYAEAFLAGAAYERSDLAAAAAHYSAVVARKDQANAPTYMGSLVGLALIAVAQGALDAAAAYEQEAWTYAAEVGGPFLRHQAMGLSTRLALARGEVAAALRASQEIGPDIHLGMSLWSAMPRLSQARALIAADDAPSLAQADTIVAGCLAEAEALHNVPLRVHTLATQALLRLAQGRRDEALATLEQAALVAAPRGMARAFLDQGLALRPLLQTLAERGVAATFVLGLLALEAPPAATAARPALAVHVTQLPEMLTRREIEILGLLTERWSDKEIAARLVIAPNTVRKHTSTIYDKLGVSSRREAVDAAYALGLLPRA